MATITLDAPVSAEKTATEEKVTANYTGGINKATIRSLFACGVLNKTAYIALVLRLEQPTDGTLQTIDPEQFAEELTFEEALAGGKGKIYVVSSSDVETAIAALQKKGALQCDKPPVQLTIGLHY